MKKRTIRLLRGLILCAALVILAAKPVVTGAADLPEEYVAAVESQSAGLYSEKLPLVPVCVTVEDFTGDRVFYTIHYFPFGSVDMSYSAADGYNMEKQLSPLA